MTSIAKELYNCLILQGGPDPCPLPPSLPSNYRKLTCFWSLISQHIGFWIHDVNVAFTSTKDTASPYIFKIFFVSMPIHLLALFLLFIMSLQRGAGSNLFILKEAKKNYMGRFIFSRGWGSICLFLFCGFPGYKPVPPGWFKICVGFIMGTSKGSPKVVFMEKPGIEPATPGLQGIALIHYTTGASLHLLIPMPKNAQLPPRLHLILWQLLYRLNKYDFSNNIS